MAKTPGIRHAELEKHRTNPKFEKERGNAAALSGQQCSFSPAAALSKEGKLRAAAAFVRLFNTRYESGDGAGRTHLSL